MMLYYNKDTTTEAKPTVHKTADDCDWQVSINEQHQLPTIQLRSIDKLYACRRTTKSTTPAMSWYLHTDMAMYHHKTAKTTIMLLW